MLWPVGGCTHAFAEKVLTNIVKMSLSDITDDIKGFGNVCHLRSHPPSQTVAQASGGIFVCPLNRSWHSLPPPRHRHCTSTSALSPRLLSNPYIPLQTRQLDALQSYLIFVQQFNEGLYGSDLAAAGAQTSTRSISRTGNRSGWCCYSTRCRGTECLNGKDSFSQTQLEKPVRSRRCSSCIAEKFELIDPSVPLSGADASTSRGQQTTLNLRPESLGLGPQVAPLSVAAGDGEALPPQGGKWPPWRWHNPDNSLLHPTTANLRTTLLNYSKCITGTSSPTS